MLTIAIISGIATVIALVMVLGANGMSDAPTEGFQGAWLFNIPFMISVTAFVLWYNGVHLP